MEKVIRFSHGFPVANFLLWGRIKKAVTRLKFFGTK